MIFLRVESLLEGPQQAGRMARQDPCKIEGRVPHAPGTKEPLQWHRLGLDKLEATLKERPWGLVASELCLSQQRCPAAPWTV